EQRKAGNRDAVCSKCGCGGCASGG
ncbi:hypothetical protein KIPB_000943, partial [Kipferlia bialata]